MKFDKNNKLLLVMYVDKSSLYFLQIYDLS